MTGRGRYRIFLGMAAGVGKTYRMLEAGHAEAEAGRDVAIGLLETHGRADTAALAVGLEMIPRRAVAYRDQRLEELDLPAVLARAPELCLIDELAHTNVPGVEHAKRYEDIEDVLSGGIDVISTLNVQHLESLKDRIAELTGVVIRETVPDAALAAADEIVLIDVSAETLLARLRDGKVYPRPRVDAALNNFFRVENLTVLREFALRQVAEEVEAKRAVTEPVAGTRTVDTSQAVGERLLALVEPDAGAQRLIRRAWRSAQRLGSDLDVLWVRPPGRAPSAEQERALVAIGQLASVLGATLLDEESDDVLDAVARVARRRGTTYILLGAGRVPRGLARLRTPLAQRLMRELPGVDVRIVADRAGRSRPGRGTP